MNRGSYLTRFLLWRRNHITDSQFMIFLSIFIGFLAGLSAVIIKNSVHFIQLLLTQGFSEEYYNFMFFLYPAVGIFLTVLFIRFVIRKKVGHGIPNVLYAISKDSGIIKTFQTYSSIITSALTVGFGGSVGLEGPSVSTGAALGSNIGQFLHLDYRRITLLIACASAGAMSAIFKAPIASIVFALEVLMLDLTLSALVPLLISSTTAAITSYFFLGQGVLYPFDVNESFRLSDITFYIFFGVLCGLISLYFTRVYFLMERFFYNIKSWYRRLVIGVMILGVLIFFIPSLYGEGYSVINSALHGDYSYLFNNSLFYFLKDNAYAVLIGFLFLISLKVVATTATFGAGGIGGIFAPTLFVGANTGLMFAYAVNLFKIGSISESNFALTGMAGMIAGVIHAPLTSIFLIAEITGGYELFVPLMITSTISYATINYFEKNSVYTRQLARRGELFTHNKDKVILSLMRVENLLETKFITVHPDATLGELVKIIPKSKRNIFPVVDEENHLHGIIHLNNIRNVMFDTSMYETTYVRNLMYFPVNVVSPSDSMETIVQKIQKSGHYNVPVLKDGKYIGFVSRANVFSKYRKMLKEFSVD